MEVAYNYVAQGVFTVDSSLLVCVLRHQLRSSWALPYPRAQLSVSTRRDLCIRRDGAVSRFCRRRDGHGGKAICLSLHGE